MSILSFNFNFSGKTKEELLAKEVYIYPKTSKQKKVEPKRLKSGQIQKLLYTLVEMQKEAEALKNQSIILNLVSAVRILPTLFSVTEQEFQEIDFEDWEYLIAKFEVKNQYFLLTLKAMGILLGIHRILEEFGKREEKLLNALKDVEEGPQLDSSEKPSPPESGAA